MIDYLKEQAEKNYAVTYVYFDYTNADQSGEIIMANLMKQVLSIVEVIPEDVQTELAVHRRQSTKPELTKYVEYFLKVSSVFRRVFVIFDGLDECSSYHMNEVVYIIN